MKIMKSKKTGRIIVAIREIYVGGDQNNFVAIELVKSKLEEKIYGIYTGWECKFFKEIGGTDGLSENNGI